MFSPADSDGLDVDGKLFQVLQEQRQWHVVFRRRGVVDWIFAFEIIGVASDGDTWWDLSPRFRGVARQRWITYWAKTP